MVGGDGWSENEGDFGLAGGEGDGVGGAGGVVADELGDAVDDHLGSVVAFEVEADAVLVLALGELVGREAVVPAELIPVVDVFAEDDDVGGGDGLVAEAEKECVGGRATGASLGGE